MRIPSLVLFILALGAGYCEAESCSSSDTENVLLRDHEYTYHYQADAFAEAVGTTDDKSKISIECDVTIYHAHTCFYSMQLQQCLLTSAGGPPGSETAWIDKQPILELSKYSVLFSLINGGVHDVIVHENDPVQFINIKKGILSAFVFKLSYVWNSTKESHIDVHGTCPITSIPIDTSKGLVKTSKDMLHCAFPSRLDWQLSPWSLFWNMTFIQYVINSTTECDYRIDNSQKRIDQVFCKERHAIMLESTHRTTTAVQTNVYYRMNYVKSAVQVEKPSYSELTRRTDILFEYEETADTESNPENFIPIAKKMLSDIVKDSTDEMRLFTITQFTDFVAWIRSAHDLLPFVKKVNSCEFLEGNAGCTSGQKELAMSYLSDALVQCNSLPCIEGISYLIQKDALSPAYVNFIYYSWSNMYVTKAEFLENLMEICKIKNSSLCWMAMGTTARRIHERNKTFGKVYQGLKKVASTFYHIIGPSCAGFKSDTSLHSDYLMFLKAVSNMGELYTTLLPEGAMQLVDCAQRNDLPLYLRTSALQTLKKVHSCQNKEVCSQIYDRLVPVLTDTSLTATLRIMAYDQVFLASETPKFEDLILDILQNDENPQLKFYIANNINSLFQDFEFRGKRKRFVTSMKELLKANQISLESIIHLSGAKSKLSTHAKFMNMSSLPDELKGFGFKLENSKIFGSQGVFPSTLNTDFTLQLFNNLVPVFESGGYFEGLEQIAVLLQNLLTDVNPAPISLEGLYNILQTLMNAFDQMDTEEMKKYNFDESVTQNIETLQKIYRRQKKNSKPFFNMHMDLFGSTFSFLTPKDIRVMLSNPQKIQHLLARLKDFTSYNVTRVVRVIEAYHQVPTMMGLPLNWTTNATLAVSMRSGLKMNMNTNGQRIHLKGYLQPSAALTFLNRMVLDFPTVTQIGVQANSSGYTSTQWKGEFNSTGNRSILRIEKPSKSQKILELFRTNQLIKHNRYPEIPDWNIDRTSSSWCTNNYINSILGLKFCLAKSYPNVTHRIKPWALMAGWCKWQFSVDPYDEKLKFYDVEFFQAVKRKSQEFALQFSMPGTETNRETSLKVNIKESSGEMKIDLKSTASPDFAVSFTRHPIMKEQKATGYRADIILKLFKDYQYQLIYQEQDKKEKWQESASEQNRSPTKENESSLVQEQTLTLETPYNIYSWNKNTLTYDERKKIDVLLSYENINSKGKCLNTVLSDTFWENESKARLQLQIDWKEPIQKANSITRQTDVRIISPGSAVQLRGKSLEMNGREQMNVDLTKTHTESGKLLAFANFSYDFWESENTLLNSREIKLFNLTIPCKSWSLQLQKTRQEREIDFEAILKRAVLLPKTKNELDYVGWWSDELSDDFRIEEKELKLTTSYNIQAVSSKALVERYSTVMQDDLDGLRNQLIPIKIALRYPLFDREESVIFDGYFILSMGPTTFRFQKNFVLESSYNNLQLTSHSVYRAQSEFISLDHHSFFTHATSQSKAFNTIKYKRSNSTGKCIEVDFHHKIESHVFHLSTDASLNCHSEDKNLHTLLLNIETYSQQWDMLNSTLNQVIRDHTTEYSREEVNFNHPIVNINVIAEWLGKEADHKKTVTFCLRNGTCPSAEFSLEQLHNGKTKIQLNLPNANETRLLYERRMSSDFKTLNFNIKHSDKENNFKDAFDLSGQILAEDYHVWNVRIDVEAFSKMLSLFSSAYKGVMKTVSDVSKDRAHAINQILKPALKMSLYDFLQGVKQEIKNFGVNSWLEVKDILQSMELFYQPALTTFAKCLFNVEELWSQAYRTIRDKSITVWAIHYFNVPYYMKVHLLNLPQNLSGFIRQLLSRNQDSVHFHFTTGKILQLDSFIEWPTISLQIPAFKGEEARLKPLHQPASHTKIAMLFGPLHVYTFDGHVFDAPNYPRSDCIYLLAHDLYKSLFTVLSSENAIHILFPEMTIKVNAENEVFINGSSVQSQLPVESQNGKAYVKKTGNVVEIYSPSLKVICSRNDYLCVLELSKWHVGGTFGLLGNADDMENNEYMLPDGKVTSNLPDFVSSYEVSGHSECKILRQESKPITTDEEEEICSGNLSNMCHQTKQVRGLFLDACLSDLKRGHSPCYAASGLSALCYYKHKTGFTQCGGRKQDDEKIRKELEVVLIVHEHRSMTASEKRNAPYKGLESLLIAIDEKFKASGYPSVLFSLIGFGGKGVHYQPTVHSTERSGWLPLQQINDVLKTLEFKGRDEADNLSALRYALEVFGYDTFHSKIFILITDSDKQIASKENIQLIQNHLEKNGITLYTFSSYPSIEKGQKIFGVRADGLIFPSHKKDGEAYIDYPKGLLAKLTSSTRGSLFLSKFLLENSPASYFWEFAEEVWAKVQKESQSCRKCKTVRSSWWWYVNECSIVHC